MNCRWQRTVLKKIVRAQLEQAKFNAKKTAHTTVTTTKKTTTGITTTPEKKISQNSIDTKHEESFQGEVRGLGAWDYGCSISNETLKNIKN